MDVVETVEKEKEIWFVDKNDFPVNGSSYEKMRFLINYAVLAPSFYNSQPWKFSIDRENEKINVYTNTDHWFEFADPGKRELFLSIGCALENLLIAADYFGMGHQTVYFPENGNTEWVASVTMVTPRKTQGPRAKELGDVIPRRHTYHSRYQIKPLSKKHIEQLNEFMTEIEYVKPLAVVTDPDTIDELDKLVYRSVYSQFSEKRYRDEITQWFNNKTFGKPWFIDKLKKFESSENLLIEEIAKKEVEVTGSAPAIAVLSSEFDDALSHVKVGQTFERVSLKAYLLGIQVYPMFQLMEIPEIKNQLLGLIPAVKGTPQLIFSLGYAKEAKKLSPRLTLDEVLI